MQNPRFNKLLEKMKSIHDKKNSDYANDQDPYSNFSFAAHFAQVPVYKVYLVLLGVKAARLHELLGKGKTPQNESTDDTLLDFPTYSALMSSNLMTSLDDKIGISAPESIPNFDDLPHFTAARKSSSRRLLSKSKVERKKMDSSPTKKRV